MPRTPTSHITFMEGYETTGYFVKKNGVTLRSSGLTIANGIDLSQISTVKELVKLGIPKATAKKWKKLGVLGKTYGELIDGGKTAEQISTLAGQVTIPDTDEMKTALLSKTVESVGKKIKSYKGKMSKESMNSMYSLTHFFGGYKDPSTFQGNAAEKRKNKSAWKLKQELDKIIKEKGFVSDADFKTALETARDVDGGVSTTKESQISDKNPTGLLSPSNHNTFNREINSHQSNATGLSYVKDYDGELLLDSEGHPIDATSEEGKSVIQAGNGYAATESQIQTEFTTGNTVTRQAGASEVKGRYDEWKAVEPGAHENGDIIRVGDNFYEFQSSRNSYSPYNLETGETEDLWENDSKVVYENTVGSNPEKLRDGRPNPKYRKNRNNEGAYVYNSLDDVKKDKKKLQEGDTIIVGDKEYRYDSQTKDLVSFDSQGNIVDGGNVNVDQIGTVAEPVAEPVTEPVTEPVVEPVVEPEPETTTTDPADLEISHKIQLAVSTEGGAGSGALTNEQENKLEELGITVVIRSDENGNIIQEVEAKDLDEANKTLKILQDNNFNNAFVVHNQINADGTTTRLSNEEVLERTGIETAGPSVETTEEEVEPAPEVNQTTTQTVDPENELDLIVPGDLESVQDNTLIIPNNQAEIDNAGLIDNGDGTFTRTNADGSQDIVIQGLDAEGNSVLVVRPEGTDIPENVTIARHPDANHPSNTDNQQGDVDPATGLVWGGLDNPSWIKPEGTSETAVWNGTEWAEPEVVAEEPAEQVVTEEVDTPVTEQTQQPEQPQLLKNMLGKAGVAGNALLQGAGAVLDTVGGVPGIISYIMGKKGLKEAMKEVKPLQKAELSPMFMQHLRQTKELAKKGFHPDETKAIRKEIGRAYSTSLENAVRGSGGQRAKFLAQSGILDANRSAALMDFAVKDADMQRKNAAAYEKMMLFKENFDINKTEQERTEDLARQTADKQAAAGFTSAAFTSLMNSYNSGKNSAVINQMMNTFKDGQGYTQLFNSIKNMGNQNNNTNGQ